MPDQPTEPTPTEPTAPHEPATSVFDTLVPDAPPGGTAAPGTAAPGTAAPDRAPEGTSAPVKPRVRSGGIAWGLIVCATAVTILAIVCVPGNARAFGAWTASLTPATIAIIGVLALGAFILLMALLSVIRRAQRRAGSRTP